MNPAREIKAIMMGMRATSRLKAIPDAKLKTQSRLILVTKSRMGLKLFSAVCTTAWSSVDFMRFQLITPGELVTHSFLECLPSHDWRHQRAPSCPGRRALLTISKRQEPTRSESLGRYCCVASCWKKVQVSHVFPSFLSLVQACKSNW